MQSEYILASLFPTIFKYDSDYDKFTLISHDYEPIVQSAKEVRKLFYAIYYTLRYKQEGKLPNNSAVENMILNDDNITALDKTLLINTSQLFESIDSDIDMSDISFHFINKRYRSLKLNKIWISDYNYKNLKDNDRNNTTLSQPVYYNKGVLDEQYEGYNYNYFIKDYPSCLSILKNKYSGVIVPLETFIKYNIFYNTTYLDRFIEMIPLYFNDEFPLELFTNEVDLTNIPKDYHVNFQLSDDERQKVLDIYYKAYMKTFDGKPTSLFRIPSLNSITLDMKYVNQKKLTIFEDKLPFIAKHTGHQMDWSILEPFTNLNLISKDFPMCFQEFRYYYPKLLMMMLDKQIIIPIEFYDNWTQEYYMKHAVSTINYYRKMKQKILPYSTNFEYYPNCQSAIIEISTELDTELLFINNVEYWKNNKLDLIKFYGKMKRKILPFLDIDWFWRSVPKSYLDFHKDFKIYPAKYLDREDYWSNLLDTYLEYFCYFDKVSEMPENIKKLFKISNIHTQFMNHIERYEDPMTLIKHFPFYVSEYMELYYKDELTIGMKWVSHFKREPPLILYHSPVKYGKYNFERIWREYVCSDIPLEMTDRRYYDYMIKNKGLKRPENITSVYIYCSNTIGNKIIFVDDKHILLPPAEKRYEINYNFKDVKTFVSQSLETNGICQFSQLRNDDFKKISGGDQMIDIVVFTEIYDVYLQRTPIDKLMNYFDLKLNEKFGSVITKF